MAEADDSARSTLAAGIAPAVPFKRADPARFFSGDLSDEHQAQRFANLVLRDGLAATPERLAIVREVLEPFGFGLRPELVAIAGGKADIDE